MERKLIVTRESFNVRKEKYKRYSELIESVKIDKEEARSQGDLSENFGYVEAKKTEENYRRSQANLDMDKPVDIIDPKEWSQSDINESPRAMLGAKLTIKRNGKEEEILIGGAWDADLNLPNVIAYTSPLAKALIPKPPGFKTILPTSGEEIEIISAACPTKEYLEKIYSVVKEQEKNPNGDNSKNKKIKVEELSIS